LATAAKQQQVYIHGVNSITTMLIIVMQIIERNFSSFSFALFVQPISVKVLMLRDNSPHQQNGVMKINVQFEAIILIQVIAKREQKGLLMPICETPLGALTRATASKIVYEADEVNILILIGLV
jgi:hypothetical protein